MSPVSFCAGSRLAHYIGGVLPLVLRLVLRSAAGRAADLGRADRSLRVCRLVQLEVHRAVGIEHFADAHPRRALRLRSPLQRRKDRLHLARFQLQCHARRPVLPHQSGHRRHSRAGRGEASHRSKTLIDVPYVKEQTDLPLLVLSRAQQTLPARIRSQDRRQGRCLLSSGITKQQHAVPTPGSMGSEQKTIQLQRRRPCTGRAPSTVQLADGKSAEVTTVFELLKNEL